MPYKDPEKKKEYDRKHALKNYHENKKHDEEWKKTRNEYLKKWKIKNPNYNKNWEKEHREERLKYHIIKNTKNKFIVMNKYGGMCVCCNENRIVFLSIDHINNDGNIHRRELKIKGGTGMYRWLIKNNFPEGFQILCMNCNHAKRFGVCPHKL